MRDLQSCLDLLGPAPPPAEALPLELAIIEELIVLKKTEQATETMTRAEVLRTCTEDDSVGAYFSLIHGRLAWLKADLQTAARCFRRAIQGFEEQDAAFYVVASLLDLCMVEIEADDMPEAVNHARQLLPALRLLGAGDEWRKLIQTLAERVARHQLEISVLMRIKQAMPRFATPAGPTQT